MLGASTVAVSSKETWMREREVKFEASAVVVSGRADRSKERR